MSRHCLYCAKELPKSSTNNFCSKECWTEYKKLKAMDVGTDKQATVLLKRSELAEANDNPNFGVSTPEPEAAPPPQPAPPAQQYEPPSPQSTSGGSDGIFEDIGSKSPSPFQPASQKSQSSTSTSSISERLTNLEILLNEKLGQSHGNAQGLLDEVTKKIDELAQRQSKLEVDMEKADSFLRTVDKFEDRLRRQEREIQTLKTNTVQARPKGFFARLFS